jgi:mRNA interferase MazF
VVIAQGEIWWADLPEPAGSEPGFRRPVVVIQSDAFNRSKIVTVDKGDLTKRVGKLPKSKLHAVLFGVDVVLGR